MSNTQRSSQEESCPASLRSVLQYYGLPATSPLKSVSGGFSGAAVWRVETGTAVFALRRWPQDGLPNGRLLGLHALLSHIRSKGVQTVAVPIANVQRSTLTWIGNECWQVEPWLPGAADFHTEPSDLRLGAAMRSLAEWHDAARTFVAAANARKWFSSKQGPCSSVMRRLSLCQQWRDQLRTLEPLIERDESAFGSLAARVAKLSGTQLTRIHSELTTFATRTVPQQSCLRDIWSDHVLFEGDRVTGLIDPSATSTANVATDLARLLGSLLSDDFNRWDQAIDGYTKHRRLSSWERTLIFTLDRAAVVLSPLTWLHRRYVEHTPIDDALVIPRLEGLLMRLQCLTGR